jgi:outer membrane protein OmpA-like peptidoglycan-associated protein/tetratricopeptide (TPR) repeat protein
MLDHYLHEKIVQYTNIMKKEIYKIFIWAVLCLFCYPDLSAQTKKAYEAAAEDAFAKENYYSALTYYNELLEFDEKNPHYVHQAAESARKFNSYKIAADKYSYLIDTLEVIPNPDVYFHAGQMYHRLGELEKAREYYDLYLSQHSKEGEYLTEQAKKEKKSLEWASGLINNPEKGVSIKHIDSEVNGPGSDFAAFNEKGKLLFSSQRFDEINPKAKPPRKISRILSEKDGAVSPLESPFNSLNKSIANHVVNSDRTKIYYTICDYIKPDELRCDIYWSKINSDGTYGDPERLPSPINDSTFTTTQPTFGIDPSTGTEVMYFASDRQGGKGKLDIWYSYFDKKLGFSNVLNAEDINTPENEITPFYHITSNILYFSTDGRNGFGGYDIFSSLNRNDKLNEPEILSVPYNGTYHDVYFKLDEKGEKGYLSSNRQGANYVDNLLQSCCYDIYEVNIEPITLKLNALTYDKKSGMDLKGAKVLLIDKKTGKIIKEIVNLDSNDHVFTLEKNTEYMVVGQKEGYKPDTIEFDTYNKKTSEEIIKKLYLETDKLELDVFTFDENTKASLAGAKVTIEDLTDPDNPIMVQVNEIGNNFNFSLDKNKKYRITATKPGYRSASIDIDTRGATGKISKNLFLARSDINRLLPIALYFDNDEPDQDSKSTETDKRYLVLEDAYYARKPVFIQKYTQGVKKSEIESSADNMNQFFDVDIKGGAERFQLFMNELLNALKEGQKIEMTIRGYASPRFDERYNLILGQRRINSVRNEMMEYNNASLAPYLINKQLIMTEISYGEELSPLDIDDNINDDKGSIYSLRASKERRVEVISVKVK